MGADGRFFEEGEVLVVLDQIPSGAREWSLTPLTDIPGCGDPIIRQILLDSSPLTISTSAIVGTGCNGCYILETDIEDPDLIIWAHDAQQGVENCNINGPGMYCVDVWKNGCRKTTCRELNGGELTYTLSTNDSQSAAAGGAVLIQLGLQTSFPVTWDLDGLESNVHEWQVDREDLLRLVDLPPGSYEIAVTDANGCTTLIDFEIEDCTLINLFEGIEFVELSDERFEAFIIYKNNATQSQINAIESSVTYEWSKTDDESFSQSGKVLMAIESGFYAVEITFPCGQTRYQGGVRAVLPPFPDCPTLDVLLDTDYTTMSGGPLSIKVGFNFDDCNDFDVTTNEYIDCVLAVVEIRDNSTYFWSGPRFSYQFPNAPTSIQSGIVPLETGRYCVTITTLCDEIFTDCYDYLHPDECPASLIDPYSKNSCDNGGNNNPPELCFDLTSFLSVMSDLLDEDESRLYIDVLINNPGSDRWLPTSIQSRETIGGGTDFRNPSDICTDLGPYEREHFNVEIYVSLNGDKTLPLCTLTIPDITYTNNEKPCESCELSTDAIGELEHYNLFFHTDLPVGCICYNACSNLEDVTANDEECDRYSVHIENGSNSITSPCAFVPGMSIHCGPALLSQEVLDPGPGVDNVVIVPFDGDGSGNSYIACDVLETENDGSCIYRCGCYFQYIDTEGNTQEVIVPSEISRDCPDIDPEDCNGPIVPDDSYDCYDFISGWCLGANNDGAPNACEIKYHVVGDQQCANQTSNFCPTECECPNGEVLIESIAGFNNSTSSDPLYDGFTCRWRLVCKQENSPEPTPIPSSGTHFLNTIIYEDLTPSQIETLFCYVNEGAQNKLYGICGDCAESFTQIGGVSVTPHEISTFKLQTCATYQLSSDCSENVVSQDPPITAIINPNFPPNTTPKSVTFSEEYTGDPAPNGITERESFYSSGVGSENGQNYFYMQANHVGCEPVEQFDYCGDNSVYWTTKLDINGEGALCGSSNMFWRSGWCACPSNPNLTFTTGWIDGQLPDNYTSTVNKTTTYKRKTNTLRKSSESKDVVLMGATATGELQVIKTYGGTGEDVATAIATVTPVAGNAGFAITGYFDTAINFSDSQSEKLSATGTDAFVAIFDTNGAYLNSRNNIVPGYDVRAKAIMPDSEGNLIMVAEVKESAQDLIGYTAIVKLDAQLNTLWTRYIVGDAHSIEPGNIIINDRDRVSIAGSFTGHISINGKTLDSDPGKHSSFILTLRKTGNPFVMQRFGDSNAPIVITGIEKGTRGRLYTSGYYTENIHLGSQFLDVGVETSSFILRTNWRGVFEEVHTFGTTGFFQINDLATDRDKNLAIVGEYAGNINVGGFDFPNDNGEERGFSIAIADVFGIDNDGEAIQIDHDLLGPASFAPEVSKVMDVYPNPFKDIFNIDYYSHISGEVVLEIFDLNGRLILMKGFDVEPGINGLQIREGLGGINGVLQLRTISVEGEVSIDRIIKLE